MSQKLYLLFYLAIVQCANIYPTSTTQYQWENSIWINCDTKAQIIPRNCENNDQNWAECYAVPTEGICLKESLKGILESDIKFQFTFYDSVTKDAIILINDKQPEYQLLTDKKIVITTQLDVTKISVQIKGTHLTLENFVVSTYCNDNCKSCNQNYDCSECQNNYSLVNYQCVPDTCFTDLSYLSTKSTQSSNAQIDSANNYAVNLQFNVNLGLCLIPKVYLVPALNTNQIEYVLQKEQIQISKNELKFYLTFDQILDHCTTVVDDSEKQIFQCEIGVALTFSKITQYTTFLVGQIRLNLQTNATSSTTQVITDTSKTVQLNVVNEITQVSISDSVLTVIQTVYDDAIKDANPVFKSATMIQDGKTYNNLQFSIAQRIDNKIRYRFKIVESSIDYNKEIELNLDASLTSNKRILQGDRTNLKIQYGVKNVYKFLPKELLKTNTSSKEQSYYMVIGVTVFFGLAGIVGCYFFLKKEKRILFVEDNKVN